MRLQIRSSNLGNTERGATLVMVAASLVVFLLLAGLAIDLVALYLGRSEAQRAADAGALAGAQQFVLSGFTSGGVTQGTVTTLATNAAEAAAEQNKVGSQTLTASDITVPAPDFSRTGNPLITVQISKSLPTFFMNIFGVSSVTVGTTATAEAFDPGGTTTGPTFCASCLKPFLVPNCDPSHPVLGSNSEANTNCGGSGPDKKGNPTGASITCPKGVSGTCYPSYFVDPNNHGAIVNPGACTWSASTQICSGGVIGEPWQLHTSAAPSQWYELSFDGSQSKSSFENAVQMCSTSVITCGTTISTMDGKAVGPNGHSVGCLITYGQTCNSQNATSTDSITVNAGSSPPFTITAGPGNPFVGSGTIIAQSSALVTVPVYDGHGLSPGKDTVTVVGYMQIFIKDIAHNGSSDDIDVDVLNTSSCGNTGGSACGSTGGGNTGGNGTVNGGGASFVSVRLVQAP